MLGCLVTLGLFLLLATGCASQATFDSPDKAVDSLVGTLHSG